MPIRSLPGLGLSWVPLGESGWDDEYNADHRVLSAFVGGKVISRVTTLPITPTLGDIYIVPAADPNGDDIAIWDGEAGFEAWVYVTPTSGRSFYVEDESKNYQWDGTAWAEFAGAGGGVAPTFTLNPGGAIVADYTLLSADMDGGIYYEVNSGSAVVLTVAPSLTAVGPVTFERVGLGSVTFAPGAGVTLNSAGSLLAIGNQFSSVTLIPKGGDVYTLLGDLA